MVVIVGNTILRPEAERPGRVALVDNTPPLVVG